jgi:predicted NUDIX family NTP pyrophosphohydrolase
MFRRSGGLSVFLVHPGGPFFARRDEGSWSVPKGVPDDADTGAGGEPDLLEVARREFEEETGLPPPARSAAEYIPLGTVKQKSGKVVHAWAFEGNWPQGRTFESNSFEMEWPPGSGQRETYPEADRGEFFSLAVAARKIIPAQAAFLERLRDHLG